MYEPLTQLIRPFPLTKELHAEVWPLHGIKGQHTAREAAPKQKSGCRVENIPGDERTVVAARLIPLALEISTMRKSDSSHGVNIIRLALASEGGG